MATKTRAELKREYRERPREAGVYQIRNRNNGKVLLGSSLNLHGPLNRHRSALRVGKHANPALQRDFRDQGEDAFDFELLEVVMVKDEPGWSVSYRAPASPRRRLNARPGPGLDLGAHLG